MNAIAAGSRRTGAWLGVLYTLLATALGGWAFLTILRFEDTVLAHEEVLSHAGWARVQVERLRANEEHAAVEARSFLLTGYAPFLEERGLARRRLLATAQALRERLDAEGQELLARVLAAEAQLQAIFDRAVELRRRQGHGRGALGATFVATQQHEREALRAHFAALEVHQAQVVGQAHAASQRKATRALRELVLVAVCALSLATALAFLLARAFHDVRRREIDLARVNEDLDAFAGRVAHDLRSVLAGLPLLAAAVRRVGEHDHSPAALADRLDRLTKRSKGVIDGLLAFSRAGQLPLSEQTASADAVAADAIDDLSPLAQAEGISVDAELSPTRARCPPALLHVALMNVLSNAIKYSAGALNKVVRVRTSSEGGRCVVSVADSGPGISPDALPHIFEPFYRAPGSRGEGAGLWLATVRRIVEAHGGGVEVASQLGSGTVARLWFPVVTNGAAEHADAPAAHAG
jgi:signal transduction histidine kinase